MDLKPKIRDTKASLINVIKGAGIGIATGLLLGGLYLGFNSYINRTLKAETEAASIVDTFNYDSYAPLDPNGDEYNECREIRNQIPIIEKNDLIFRGDNMFDFDFPQYTPKTNVPELRRAPEKEQPKAKDLPFDLKAMKLALKMRETGGKMNSKNRQTGASGSYQYLPSTAIGLIKQAKREGYDVPYNGRMTKADVSYALRTNKNLNE